MPNYALCLVAALLLPLCLYGCAFRTKGILTQDAQDVERVLALLRQRENDLKTFKGVGRFKTVRGNCAKIFRVVWIGSKPQNLRVETLGPWGQPNLTFVVNGPRFFLHSRQDNRYFRGNATEGNLRRVMSIPVEGEDLFKLLSGQPPILPFHRGKIHISSAYSGSILSLYKKWGRLIEKIWLTDAGKSVEKVEVFDEWGNLQYRIAFSEFHQTESFWLPRTIAISDREGPICSLTVERFWTNVPIPEGAYTMESSGAEVTDFDS